MGGARGLGSATRAGERSGSAHGSSAGGVRAASPSFDLVAVDRGSTRRGRVWCSRFVGSRSIGVQLDPDAAAGRRGFGALVVLVRGRSGFNSIRTRPPGNVVGFGAVVVLVRPVVQQGALRAGRDHRRGRHRSLPCGAQGPQPPAPCPPKRRSEHATPRRRGGPRAPSGLLRVVLRSACRPQSAVCRTDEHWMSGARWCCSCDSRGSELGAASRLVTPSGARSGARESARAGHVALALACPRLKRRRGARWARCHWAPAGRVARLARTLRCARTEKSMPAGTTDQPPRPPIRST